MIGLPGVFVSFLLHAMVAVVNFVKLMIMCCMAIYVGCAGVKISVQ
jgi:hypothetical protein